MANNLPASVPERTFQHQNSLPPLPVPSLEISLSKYLDAGGVFALFCVIIQLICRGFEENWHLYPFLLNVSLFTFQYWSW